MMFIKVSPDALLGIVACQVQIEVNPIYDAARSFQGSFRRFTGRGPGIPSVC